MVSQREVQPDPATGTDCNTATENPKMVSQEEGHSGQWPELVYPAKLTEQEQADTLAAQADPLPPEIAQQMLDVIDPESTAARSAPTPPLHGVSFASTRPIRTLSIHPVGSRLQTPVVDALNQPHGSGGKTGVDQGSGQQVPRRLSEIGRASLASMLTRCGGINITERSISAT